jgi:hypothetical protein
MVDSKVMWWGYRHINGTLHLKRFHSQASVDEAYESDFVEDVLDPFPAENREEASAILRRFLKP